MEQKFSFNIAALSTHHTGFPFLHKIGEKLIKPCKVEAACFVSDQNCATKVNQIRISDTIVKQRIDDMPKDIRSQFISENHVEEEFLFGTQLMTKVKDTMNIVSNFFEEKSLLWAELVGVCMDGAPSVLGSNSGFTPLVKIISSYILTRQCQINSETLAFLTLPDLLKAKEKKTEPLAEDLQQKIVEKMIIC
ncbi:protein FAM200C-like [Palaemon carinicauda]|uniref:protein FAM200C-like n=1 Tax=Palaemon carinicauda TaxID=392227 RepID=UPI0035B60F13